MPRRHRRRAHLLYGDPGPPGSALSVTALLQLLLAIGLAVLGFLKLPAMLLGPGLIGIALLLGISARMCQARAQHMALFRLLDGQPPP